MRPQLKLLPRILVDVRRGQHCPLSAPCGQPDGPCCLCLSGLCSFHNLVGGLLDTWHPVRAELDFDLLLVLPRLAGPLSAGLLQVEGESQSAVTTGDDHESRCSCFQTKKVGFLAAVTCR